MAIKNLIVFASLFASACYANAGDNHKEDITADMLYVSCNNEKKIEFCVGYLTASSNYINLINKELMSKNTKVDIHSLLNKFEAWLRENPSKKNNKASEVLLLLEFKT